MMKLYVFYKSKNAESYVQFALVNEKTECLKQPIIYNFSIFENSWQIISQKVKFVTVSVNQFHFTSKHWKKHI